MKLQFLIDGKLYPLNRETIYLSNLIHFLYRCPYRYASLGLLSDRDEVNEKFRISKSKKESRRDGAKKHEEREKLLGLVIGKTCEVKILFEFRGIPFRGFLDHFMPPNTFEEWHFKTSINPTLTPHELSYPNAQAFFLCKILKVPEVEYKYMVWGRDTSPLKFPDKIISKIYSSPDFKYTITELDNLIKYHTGKISCERTGGGCDFCEVKEPCERNKLERIQEKAKKEINWVAKQTDRILVKRSRK